MKGTALMKNPRSLLAMLIIIAVLSFACSFDQLEPGIDQEQFAKLNALPFR